MKLTLSFILALMMLSPLSAQRHELTPEDQKHYLQLLDEFLTIPNNGLFSEHIEPNITWLIGQFENYGFEAQRLENEGQPLFFAEKITDPELPTVLFYMHLDGQPVDTLAWDQDDPYDPVYKSRTEMGGWQIIGDEVPEPPYNEEWRVFARSASDDKGPIAMLIAALNEMEQEGAQPAFNIKVILDGEEELGSPNILPALQRYAELLASDYLVVSDGPMHDSGLPTLTYGVRGITSITIEIYGPARPQHSGHFGNYAPNPVYRAAHLLASMKDEEGRVIIPGYYDGIEIGEMARQAMDNVPDDEERIQARAGFAEPEKVGSSYQEAIQYPSLNVSGIRSGWVGDENRTIVPDKVIIEMDIRTVPESDGQRLAELVKEHVRSQGYTLLNSPPTPQQMLEIEKPVYFEYSVDMYPFRTSLDTDLSRWLKDTLEKAHGEEVVQVRILGGSLPISFFLNELKIPAILVPLVNADNNQHSPNENLRFANYFNGIHTFKHILTNPFPAE